MQVQTCGHQFVLHLLFDPTWLHFILAQAAWSVAGKPWMRVALRVLVEPENRAIMVLSIMILSRESFMQGTVAQFVLRTPAHVWLERSS